MKVPGGGLVSTAGDLARFAIAINTLALVNQKTRLEMWTIQKTRDGQATGYGLGWGVEGEGERMLVSHSGGQAGTSTLLTMMPSKGTIIAVMANLQGANLGNMVGQIGRLLVPQQARSQ
jgi:CubicO group peptidase (beta-lactamase class C family)